MEREGHDKNPYAPPVESASVPPTRVAPSTLSLSGQGWDVVTSMARWMRIVSVAEFVAAGLMVVGGLIMLTVLGKASGLGAELRWGALAIAGLFVMAGLFVLGGTWLRQSAGHFYDGVLADAERPLADGFRKLRLYLILYGIYSILGLAAQVYALVVGKGG